MCGPSASGSGATPLPGHVLTVLPSKQAQQEHQSRERQLEEHVAALRHRLGGEVARFSAATEAMQLAAAQEQQVRGQSAPGQ